MEEKVIVKSELMNIKKFWNIMTTLGVIMAAIHLILRILSSIAYGLALIYAMSYIWYDLLVMAGCFFVMWGIGAIIYKMFSKTEMIVTDKRVYGTAKFGKRVDLPLDSISAVGTSAFKGIGVTTSSGAIKFRFIKNRDELHSEVSKLLIERQNKSTATISSNISSASNADELKKYKELLDGGIISQEEFNAKKKQLLGL